MIEVRFSVSEDKTVSMDMKGHAGSAPKGEDLICASATTLVYTVAQAMTFYEQQGFLAEKPKIKIREGKASIHVVPKEEYRAETLHSFWVAQCGAHTLACNYPEAVSLNHLTV